MSDKTELIKVSEKTMNRYSLAYALGFQIRSLNSGKIFIYFKGKERFGWEIKRDELFDWIKWRVRKDFDFEIVEPNQQTLNFM